MDSSQLYRVRILESAKEIIKTEGIDKLTVSNLAKKCKISKRTFYELFPSKKLLIDQLKQDDDDVQIIDQRSVIIENARNQFAHNSFNNIDMDEIATAAGLKRATLYKYFKSKEELLECCIEYETNMIKREAGRTLSNAENPREALEEFITSYCAYISDPHPNSLFSEAYNHMTHNKKIDQCAKSVHHFFVNSFTNLLETGITKGIFYNNLDAEGTAVAILASLSGLDFFSKINPLLDIKVQIRDSILTLLFNTILVK